MNYSPRARGLLRLFVQSMLAAPRAVLLHLQARLQGLLVFLRMVVHVLANRTLEMDQVVLGHRYFFSLVR